MSNAKESAMRYGPIPGTEREASRIVLGTAWFGTAIAEDAAFRLMDTTTSNRNYP